MQKRLSYQPVGKCIYCLSNQDLTEEHIIPYSLGGTVKLPASSCRRCADITSEFERELARSMYGDLRIRANLPTRRRAKRPLMVRAKDAVTGSEVWLRPEESLTIIPTIEFLAPGMLREPPEEPTGAAGAKLGMKELMPTDYRRWKVVGSNQYTFTGGRIDPDCYALTLAKIAHAYTVADFGLSNFEPFLPPIILGDRRKLYTYVGGSPTPLRDQNMLHSVRLHLGHPHYGSRADWLLLASISLLSAYDMPTALIVVGRADRNWALDETRRRQHSPPKLEE